MKKLTMTVDIEVYDGLQRVIGPRRISRFLNDLAQSHGLGQPKIAARRRHAIAPVQRHRKTGTQGLKSG